MVHLSAQIPNRNVSTLEINGEKLLLSLNQISSICKKRAVSELCPYAFLRNSIVISL